MEKKDKDLIEKFLAGDESAFNELAKKYFDKIYWHALRMLGDPNEADDAVQEVLITMFEKLKDFKFNSEFSTWIYRITHNKCLNRIRKNKIKNFFSFDDEVEVSTNEETMIVENIDYKTEMKNVLNFLKELPIKQREAFIMRTFDELSYEEISKITGKSVGTLKANYFHALKKLKEKIKDEA